MAVRGHRFVVAGLAVEAVTGRPLHEAYRRHVLDPLGQDRTWLEHHEGPRTAEPSRALVPDPDGPLRPVADVDTLPDWAGGGLVSTAADLERLARGLHDGSVLDPGAYAEITTGRAVDARATTRTGWGWGVPTCAGSRSWGTRAPGARLRTPPGPGVDGDRHRQPLQGRPPAGVRAVADALVA